MSNLTPDDIERMDAVWDAIDAGLAKGDPRFAGYMATRARARLTHQIMERKTVDDQHTEALIAAIKQIGSTLADISQHLKNLEETLEETANDQGASIANLDETLAEKLELLGDATREQAEATRVGFDLLRLEVRNVGGEINALRTSDR